MSLSFSFSARRCLRDKRADVFHFDPQFDEVRLALTRTGVSKPLAAVTRRYDQTRNPTDEPDTQFRYVDIGNVSTQSGKIVDFSRILGARAPSRARRVLPAGAILVSTVRPNRRAIAIVPDHLSGAIGSTGFCVLVPDPEQVERHFLWAFLRGSFGTPQIVQLGRGASYPAILEHELGTLLVPIFDAESVQNPVAAKVVRAEQLEDQASRTRSSTLAILASYVPPAILHEAQISSPFSAAQAALEGRADARFFDARHHALMDRFRDIAKSGKAGVATIGGLGEPLRRGVQPEYRLDGTVPVLKTVDVRNDKVDWASCLRVTDAFFEKYPRGQLKRGDIVITSTGEGSWGRAAIVDVDRAVAAVDLLVLRVDPQIVDPYAVVAFFWSEFGQLQFAQRVRGSTGQTHLYRQDVERMQVLLPNNEDQRHIAAGINARFAQLAEAEQLRNEAVRDVENFVRSAL